MNGLGLCLRESKSLTHESSVKKVARLVVLAVVRSVASYVDYLPQTIAKSLTILAASG